MCPHGLWCSRPSSQESRRAHGSLDMANHFSRGAASSESRGGIEPSSSCVFWGAGAPITPRKTGAGSARMLPRSLLLCGDLAGEPCPPFCSTGVIF